MASICASSSASASSGSCSPRSSSAAGGTRKSWASSSGDAASGARDCPVTAASGARGWPVAVASRGSGCPADTAESRISSLAAAACSCSQWRTTVRRCTAKLRANASTDESSRCCKPTTSRPAAAWALPDALACRASRAVRYSSSRRDSASSGASAGSPSMTTRSTRRSGKPPCVALMSSFRAPDHDILERLPAPHLDAAREPVGVEQLEQGREAVRVAVVRRRRQEQPVLEASREVADGAGELRLDAVAPAARRRRVVRLVEDEQAAGPQGAEPRPHGVGVARVDQQVVRHEEPAVGHPRVHAEAALAPHPRQVGAVENLEDQPETVLQLALPLLEHRRRRRHDDGLRLPAQQQLAGDQPRLDGLAEPGVVGDEQVDPRQPQRLAQRLHLVGVDPDAGAERRLEEVGVGGRHAVPPQRVQERREPARVVEAPLGEVLPALLFEDAAVDLVVPIDAQRLSLRVVVRADQRHQWRLAGRLRRRDLLDQPPAGAHLDQLADLGGPFRQSADLIGWSHGVRERTQRPPSF